MTEGFKLGKFFCNLDAQRIAERVHVDKAVVEKFVFDCVGRYERCDWGDVSLFAKAKNDAEAKTKREPVEGLYAFTDGSRKTLFTLFVLTAFKDGRPVMTTVSTVFP
jgi:hypothetical protein